VVAIGLSTLISCVFVVMSDFSAGIPAEYTSSHMSAYVSIRLHTSAYVSIREHTSAYVSTLISGVVVVMSDFSAGKPAVLVQTYLLY
jgi:hypothetical protein